MLASVVCCCVAFSFAIYTNKAGILLSLRNIFMSLQMIFLHIQILQILVVYFCIELEASHNPQDQLFQSGLTLLPILCELHQLISIKICSMLFLQFHTTKNLIKLFLGNPSFSFSFYKPVILSQEKLSAPSNMLSCSYSVPSFIFRLVNT